MAESLPSVQLPQSTWVDIYAATGIPVGTEIIIQNLGDASAILSESSTEPLSTVGYNNIEQNEYRVNSSGSIGAWAWSMRGTKLQVEIA